MKRRASPTRIGLFVVGGLALLALGIVIVAGNELFTRKERAVMHFNGSVYGLQIGAPVVFRGVRVGTVSSIQVLYDRGRDTFTIPVFAELERDAVRGLAGGRNDAAYALPALVQRGLSAQLTMQSLLTGLLYIDLDMRPGRSRESHGGIDGAVEIPTTATAIQHLKEQLEQMDFKKLLDEVSEIAQSLRTLASGPELKQALRDVGDITTRVKRLATRLDERVGPLTDDAQRTLAGARSAVERVGAAAEGVRDTARHLGATSERLSALLAPDSPLVHDLRSAAAELSTAAAALRRTTSEDSTLLRNAERALHDVSRASRALGELADLLDRHPEALLRGRPQQE
jgi:phospholipid/cholesterol/gamma-HCH transport system substrate-binding protein